MTDYARNSTKVKDAVQLRVWVLMSSPVDSGRWSSKPIYWVRFLTGILMSNIGKYLIYIMGFAHSLFLFLDCLSGMIEQDTKLMICFRVFWILYCIAYCILLEREKNESLRFTKND